MVCGCGGFELIQKYKPIIFMEAHFHMYYNEEKHKNVQNFLNDLGYTTKEFKHSSYLFESNRLLDGKHTGKEIYDLHYKILFEPPNSQN